ncbi:MAG TPA: dihydrolipoamide acetyltransferase family protein [Planctomycetota bacterium]|nr:dihydrolipoamide acetyltransferase family protein [Planctomycetota bacterium]
MTLEFKLPDIGEGTAEGEIVKWLVSVGDVVAEHQPVVEVMTDKATVEIPAPAPGKLTRLLAEEGDTVPVGSVIFHLETEGAAGTAEPGGELEPAEATHTPVAVLAGPAGAAPERKAASGRVPAVPSARRVARELGIDLAQVAGSGRNGVVRRADVEAHAGAGGSAREGARLTSAPAQTSTPVASAGDRRIPFRGVRRKIAEAMCRSVYTIPHFTVVEEVDVTDLVTVRSKAKALGAGLGVKVTFMPFIMKAVALGLECHPMLNGYLDEQAGEIVQCAAINLGIATDTPNGLIVPVVRGVQDQTVMQLAGELGELAQRTREGRVKADELRGSTFSITNAGSIGGTLATPIINFPDIAILGVHRIVKRPGVVETLEGDKIEVRLYMNFSLSVDHRLADGADGARFLAYLRQLLESPGLLTP